jgi:hypothetical protein
VGVTIIPDLGEDSGLGVGFTIIAGGAHPVAKIITIRMPSQIDKVLDTLNVSGPRKSRFVAI